MKAFDSVNRVASYYKLLQNIIDRDVFELFIICMKKQNHVSSGRIFSPNIVLIVLK